MTIFKERLKVKQKHHEISDIPFFHSTIIQYQIFRENLFSKSYRRNSPIPAHLSSRRCCSDDAWASVYLKPSTLSTIMLLAPRAPSRHN